MTIGDWKTAEPRAAGSAIPVVITDGPGGARRPWWIWAAPFAVLFTTLIVRNRFLFTTRLYERADSAANSILIQQAMHFTLLVGNYSRENFNHPGPAYMYVQAFGQWLFYDGLHVVPTAWNAHVLAVFALDSAFMALAVLVVYGWTGSLRGAAACLTVILIFAASHPQAVNNDWMPYMYIPTYCVFVIAAASVAAGHSRDAWILALTGWFLIHGQACFLFFVPFIIFPVLVALVWAHRQTPAASLRRFVRGQRKVWIPVVAISILFALPIVVNLALNWPGDFGKYFAYGRSAQAGHHSAAQIAHFVLWFWWPHSNAWLAPVLLYGLAIGVTFGLTRGPLRRFFLALLGINLVSSLALCIYAAVGIDFLSEYYIGYFYWSVPMITLLVIVVGVGQAMGPRIGTAAAAAGAVTALVVLAALPGLRTSTQRTDPSLPGAVARLAAMARGRTIVLTIGQTQWGDTTGFLVQAERTQVRACVDEPWWTFMMTKQFICTPQEAETGVHYWFDSLKPPPHAPVIFRFGGSDVAAKAG
ncbi:MAG TPA: hypothetical protein VE733_04040 [Streptosporangiaceae bacterium]|nr:hypothetical protein [Streptosporangiaceae bacterium]